MNKGEHVKTQESTLDKQKLEDIREREKRIIKTLRQVGLREQARVMARNQEEYGDAWG